VEALGQAQRREVAAEMDPHDLRLDAPAAVARDRRSPRGG
jgi:hypothetical protein